MPQAMQHQLHSSQSISLAVMGDPLLPQLASQYLLHQISQRRRRMLQVPAQRGGLL